MAFTATKQESSVFGNMRVWHGLVTADAASGVVSFGFGNLISVNWSPKSMTTDCARVRINALASGTASVGDLGVSGVANGDEFYVIVYGR